MVKRARKTQKTRTRRQTSVINHELVVVFNAETMEEAKEYENLLKNNEIPAMVRKQDTEFGEKSYAVLVPDDMTDEAHVIVESQDAYDDFYDLGLDSDEEDDDLEGDVFEEGS